MQKLKLEVIDSLMRSGFSGIAVNTTEPARLDVSLADIARRHKYLLARWDISQDVSLSFFPSEDQVVSIKPESVGWAAGGVNLALTKILLNISKQIEEIQTGRDCALGKAYAQEIEAAGFESAPLKLLFVIHDADALLPPGGPNTAMVARFLLNAIQQWKVASVMFVLVGAQVPLSPSLEHEVVRLEFPLPDADERMLEVEGCLKAAEKSGKKNKELNLGTREDHRRLVSAGAGMSRYEFQNALFLAVNKYKSLGVEAAEAVFSMKVGSLESGGVLKYIPTPAGGYANVGGLDAVKSWMASQTAIMKADCKAYGINQPKGVLLSGIAGNGKTLLAGAIASEAGKPLFRANLDALSASLQGETEARTAKLLDTLDTLGDCVVLIDEIEKFFSKQGLEGHNASPAHQKAFGRILNWLSDRNGGAYLVATANNLDLLPTPLIRRQRWDELFWVDNPKNPMDVLKVVFSRMRRSAACEAVSDWLMDFAESNLQSWSGAELECLCHQAAKAALVTGDLPMPEEDKKGSWIVRHFPKEATTMIPMERLKSEEYAANRQRAAGVMRDAQEVEAKPTTRKLIKSERVCQTN